MIRHCSQEFDELDTDKSGYLSQVRDKDLPCGFSRSQKLHIHAVRARSVCVFSVDCRALAAGGDGCVLDAEAPAALKEGAEEEGQAGQKGVYTSTHTHARNQPKPCTAENYLNAHFPAVFLSSTPPLSLSLFLSLSLLLSLSLSLLRARSRVHGNKNTHFHLRSADLSVSGCCEVGDGGRQRRGGRASPLCEACTCG